MNYQMFVQTFGVSYYGHLQRTIFAMTWSPYMSLPLVMAWVLSDSVLYQEPQHEALITKSLTNIRNAKPDLLTLSPNFLIMFEQEGFT